VTTPEGLNEDFHPSLLSAAFRWHFQCDCSSKNPKCEDTSSVLQDYAKQETVERTQTSERQKVISLQERISVWLSQNQKYQRLEVLLLPKSVARNSTLEYPKAKESGKSRNNKRLRLHRLTQPVARLRVQHNLETNF
jgi:hypothetical protein